MIRFSIILAAPLMLGACAMNQNDGVSLPGDTTADMPMDQADGFTCSADAAAELVGQTPSQALGTRALALTGAASLRWIGPDTVTTKDFREDRLNIHYGADYKISKLTCA